MSSDADWTAHVIFVERNVLTVRRQQTAPTPVVTVLIADRTMMIIFFTTELVIFCASFAITYMRLSHNFHTQCGIEEVMTRIQNRSKHSCSSTCIMTDFGMLVIFLLHCLSVTTAQLFWKGKQTLDDMRFLNILGLNILVISVEPSSLELKLCCNMWVTSTTRMRRHFSVMYAKKYFLKNPIFKGTLMAGTRMFAKNVGMNFALEEN